MKQTLISFMILIWLFGCHSIPDDSAEIGITSPPNLGSHSEWIISLNEPIYNPPVVSNDLVYIVDQLGHLIAIELNSGKIVWQVDTRCKLSDIWILKPCTPDFYKDYILFGSFDNCLHCIHQKTGKEVWKFKAEHWVSNQILVCGDIAYFGDEWGILYALSLPEKRLVWKKQFSEQYIFFWGKTISNRTVFFTKYGSPYESTLRVVDMQNGNIIWEKLFKECVTSVEATTDYVYISENGHVIALGFNDGRELWTAQLSAKSMVVNKESLFVAENNRLCELNALSGKTIWSKPFGILSTTSGVLAISGLAVHGKNLIVSADTLYIVSCENGEVLYKYGYKNLRITSPITVVGEQIIFGALKDDKTPMLIMTPKLEKMRTDHQ